MSELTLSLGAANLRLAPPKLEICAAPRTSHTCSSAPCLLATFPYKYLPVVILLCTLPHRVLSDVRHGWISSFSSYAVNKEVFYSSGIRTAIADKPCVYVCGRLMTSILKHQYL